MSAGDDLLWRRGVDDQISCVEVAVTPDSVAMRHSDQPAGPWLVFSRSAWADFVAGVRAGEFDADDLDGHAPSAT
ncbi:MAG: DUF397 domain-containing protein [Micromonosporaceae bacterium]|nr:DUF397 domain-containing protein [Micromonosporaceae bacterium]